VSDARVRERWIDAIARVGRGELTGIPCPVNVDADLDVEWIPFKNGPGGEYWLHCPECGAQTFALFRHDPPGVASNNGLGQPGSLVCS